MFITVTFVTMYVGGSVGKKPKRRPKKAFATGREIRLALGEN